MRVWRVASIGDAGRLDGGYGLANNGRWNSRARPVTYCSTVPSLGALEKRVHVTNPGLLPPQVMVQYDAPDDLPLRRIEIGDLPSDWITREIDTQQRGDIWLDGVAAVLLIAPSLIVPIASAPHRNVLINHRHADAARIRIVDVVPFTLDPRLFKP